MAEATIPTRSTQPNTDSGLEISPDGNPIVQMGAPSSASRVAAKAPTTMAEAPTVDDSDTTLEAAAPAETTLEKPPADDDALTDFSEFLKVKETGELTDGIQKQKATDKVSTEGEVQEGTVSKDKGATTQQQIPHKQKVEQDLKSRDLTGLPEELVPHFQKDMSRAAFDKVKPLIIEHKALKEKTTAQEQELERLRKGAIPDSYYDNPNGYILDPEYQQAEGITSQARGILSHWQEQFKKVRDGATDYDMLGYNAQGQLTVIGKQPADKNSEMNILQIVNNAQQQLFKVASKAEAIRENFGSRHTNAIGWLNNYETKAFQFFDTPQGKAFEPQLTSIMSEFPAEFKKHPLAKVLAKSIATNVHLATLLTQNAGKGGAQPTTATATPAPGAKTPSAVKQQRRAGPTVADVGADASGAGDGEKGSNITMDDFNRVREQE